MILPFDPLCPSVSSLLIYASLCHNCEKLHCNMLLSEHLLSLEDLVRMGRPNKSVVGLSREEKMMMCIGDIIQVCTQTAAVLGACTGFTVF